MLTAGCVTYLGITKADCNTVKLLESIVLRLYCVISIVEHPFLCIQKFLSTMADTTAARMTSRAPLEEAGRHACLAWPSHC